MSNNIKKDMVDIKKPPELFLETQSVIKQIEEEIDGTFISYWVSDNSRIIGEDAQLFYDILNDKNSPEKVYLFIKSEGGSGQGSLRIVHLIRQYVKNFTALVPLDCASAATMLVLGANEIQMGALAYLSAVDTSITHELSPVDKNNRKVSVSQNELSRVLKLWQERQGKGNKNNPYDELYKHIHPLVFGAVDRASSLSIRLCNEILSYHMKDAEQASRISEHLNSAYPSHGYPITIKEAQKIGLNVNSLPKSINDKLLKLHELYSEMAQLAYTDYDERNYHDNEILKIVEGSDIQAYYQKDKDWHYREAERRWVPMNDNSSWRKIQLEDGKVVKKAFHIR